MSNNQEFSSYHSTRAIFSSVFQKSTDRKHSTSKMCCFSANSSFPEVINSPCRHFSPSEEDIQVHNCCFVGSFLCPVWIPPSSSSSCFAQTQCRSQRSATLTSIDLSQIEMQDLLWWPCSILLPVHLWRSQLGQQVTEGCCSHGNSFPLPTHQINTFHTSKVDIKLSQK